MAAVHPGGDGSSWPARKLRKDPLESHEVLGGGERGEIHLQIHSASDRTLVRGTERCSLTRQTTTSARGVTLIITLNIVILQKNSDRCMNQVEAY